MPSAASPPCVISCTLWIHDETFSTEPVVFNTDLLPEDSRRTGRLLKVLGADQFTSARDAAQQAAPASDVRDYATSRPDSHNASHEASVNVDAQSYVFTVGAPGQSDRIRLRNLQISVSKHVASVHGFYSRMPVLVKDANYQEHAASHVELSFSDPLNRADLWKTTISELSRRKCVYQGQELLFLGNIKIVIKKLFVDGHRAPSGIFTRDSRAIFRSTSARFIVGIQISREMFDVDDELSGGIVWAKASDFVATLLERWKSKGTRHMLSIVLFTRLDCVQHERDCKRVPIDLYRVVASDLPEFQNAKIMHILNRSFRSFTQEIRQRLLRVHDPEDIVERTTTTARRGNFLEAINVAISACWLDELDLDFERTGTSIVMVSPGCGSFEIEENLLRITGDRLAGRSIGVELVCLSAAPLHVVPLFILEKYLALRSLSGAGNSTALSEHTLFSDGKKGALAGLDEHDSLFVLPSWIEASFYQSSWTFGSAEHAQSSEAHQLVKLMRTGGIGSPAASMFESNTSFSITALPELDSHISANRERLESAMDTYDESLFTPAVPGTKTGYHFPQPTAKGNKAPPHAQSSSSRPGAFPSTAKSVIKEKHLSGQSSALASDSTLKSTRKSRFSSLLGHTALGKAGATTGSSVEHAQSTSRSRDSQSYDADSKTVSDRLHLSLSRTSSSSLVQPTDSSADTVGRRSGLVPETKTTRTPVDQASAYPDSPRSSLDTESPVTNEVHVSKRAKAGPDNPIPIRSLLPWLVIRNPCKVVTEALDAFGEWSHAFTSERRAHAVKWKALCAPASLPLTTEHYPFRHELLSAFTESPYRISLNVVSAEDQNIEKRRARLAREMVLYRVSEGYQIAVGAAADSIIGPQAADAADFYADDFMGIDGAAVMMLKGDKIHVLCSAGGEVTVRRYHRKAPKARAVKHQPWIRTYMDKEYSQQPLLFQVRADLNWSKLDTQLAEAEAFSYERQTAMPITSSYNRRARFVLIPVDAPSQTKGTSLGVDETAEELRLDGIRKLTTLWQKHRWVSPEDEKHHASWLGHKDVNPLAIEYQTRDPSAIVAAGFESSILTEGESTAAMTHLFDDEEQYRSSHVDIKKLAVELQSERGINVRPRRWHFRVYEFCFVGHDLTSFLLGRFQDISTREEAVEFGNVLMQNGLFRHVNNKHRFRDGNYFFTINKDYRGPKGELKPNWFNVRKVLSSVPATPLGEGPKDPLDDFLVNSRDALVKRPRVMLSGAVQHNIDSKRVSTRPEIITIHYDRLHNPENAFHFMLEWTNATAKLVEDALSTWGSMASKHCLRLVQVPIAEVVKTPQINPFRSPYLIEMALQTAPLPPVLATDSPKLKPVNGSTAKHFQRELLKRFDFVLDFEASSSFPDDVDVEYTYGQGAFDYDQYVHRSGLLLAEIVEDWKFVILANRLCDSHMSAVPVQRSSLAEALSRSRNSPLPRQVSGAALSTITDAPLSPVISPGPERPSRATGPGGGSLKRMPTGPFGRPGEHILEDFEKFCHDANALRRFYEDLTQPTPERPTPSLSAVSAAQTPHLKASIPILDLPEALNRNADQI